MMKVFFLVFIGLILMRQTVIAADYSKLYGQWKGVKMFQDEDSYDGKTFFLPNEGEMVLDQKSVKLYYYPYFKGAEYAVTYTPQSILYQINEKPIKCDYHFKGDTLVFKMFYINKVFVKFFTRTELDEKIIKELDEFGFRTEKLTHEFELDTLHKDQRKGFSSYDSLSFKPYYFLEFKDDNTLVLNRKEKVSYIRGFKQISYSQNGVMQQLEVVHIGGTQDIFLKPTTQCHCDSIVLPYLAVSWADRIRQAIIDEENF